MLKADQRGAGKYDDLLFKFLNGVFCHVERRSGRVVHGDSGGCKFIISFGCYPAQYLGHLRAGTLTQDDSHISKCLRLVSCIVESICNLNQLILGGEFAKLLHIDAQALNGLRI